MKRAPILRSVIVMVLFLTVITALGFGPAGYVVKAHIAAPNGTIFYLRYQYKDKLVTDSATAAQNSFEFKGTLPEPVICTLSNSANHQIKIFVGENSTITLDGQLEKLFDLKVGNAEEDRLYNTFKDQVSAISTQYRASVARMGVNLHDQASLPSLRYHQQLDSLTDTFLKAYPQHVASALVIIDCYITNPDRTRAKHAYQQLKPAAQQSIYGQRIAQFVAAQENISIGHPAPDFSLKDSLGKSHQLKDYRGKYLLLDFWASWCAPCRKENPNLTKCYQQYAGENLQFVSISMDASQSSWKQAVSTDHLAWLQLNDPASMNGNVADSYGVKAIPFNCIIDPKGIIVAVNLRGDALNNYMQLHFKANK